MSRKVIQIGEEDIDALTQQVNHTFGGNIKTKKNVFDLIDAIVKQHPKDVISFNTLRRFFKLIPSTHTPTIETLNILCRYCGYSSWDEFTYVANQNSENLLGHSLIQMMRHQWSKEHARRMIDHFGKSERLYHWLSTVFHHLNDDDKIFLVNESFTKIISPQNENSALGYAQYFWVQTIGCYLMQLNETECRRRIKEINHPKIIAELCVSYNMHDSHYDILLAISKPTFVSIQDLIFFDSISYLRHFLRHHSFTPSQLISIQNWNIHPGQIDIKPFSRMRALQIISLSKKEGLEKIIATDLNHFKKHKSFRESIVFYIIEIARALCYVNQAIQSKHLFQQYTDLYQGNIGFWASIHRNTLYLYASWAFALNDEKEKASAYLQLFNSSLIENFQEECISKDLATVKKLLKRRS